MPAGGEALQGEGGEPDDEVESLGAAVKGQDRVVAHLAAESRDLCRGNVGEIGGDEVEGPCFRRGEEIGLVEGNPVDTEQDGVFLGQ